MTECCYTKCQEFSFRIKGHFAGLPLHLPGLVWCCGSGGCGVEVVEVMICCCGGGGGVVRFGVVTQKLRET